MWISLPRWCAALLLILSGATDLSAQTVNHEIRVSLRPEQQWLRVEDRMTLPEILLEEDRPGWRSARFDLHEGLRLSVRSPGVEIRKRETSENPARDGSRASPVGMEVYKVSIPIGQAPIVDVEYEGKIAHPLQTRGGDYARRSSETPGTISPEGVFLSGTTHWYPSFPGHFLTFGIEIELPAGWGAVSQGARTRSSKEGEPARVTWKEAQPQEEIFLVAGPFTEYSLPTEGVEIMAFLRSPDPELARKYMDRTAHYLALYGDWIGPYPYRKFALVENFWETGYGMPSFTLLGPRVIRLPFILDSSYPHEILHNWWGNGVYVDAGTGNWSEGLTTYLADHLFQEQRGSAAEYRRMILQKYRDYVSEGEDFPLKRFRARHSSATEAVGYGKTLMVFHMLRHRLGDAAFREGLRRFYAVNRFRAASFGDIQAAFAETTRQSLEGFFEQWVGRTGAPDLRVKDAQVDKVENGYRLTAILEQRQSGPAYELIVPIAVHLEGRSEAFQTSIGVTSKHLKVVIPLPERPLLLEIDPEFDLFRKLDRREIAPALSLAFGARRAVVILPSGGNARLRAAYRKMAESWQGSGPDQLELVSEDAIEKLPSDRAVWILGWDNRFRRTVEEALAVYAPLAGNDPVRISDHRVNRGRESITLTVRHPDDPSLALVWLASDRPDALTGLGRKLPHYGSYSYLVFEGDDPSNIVKGTWPLPESPLKISLDAEKKEGAAPPGALAPRAPLVPEPERISENLD